MLSGISTFVCACLAFITPYVSILYQRGFFDDVEPVNFNTIATPHLGLPRYPSLISRLASHLGPKILSRTGEQFYCADNWSTGRQPLLEVMADPGMSAFARAFQATDFLLFRPSILSGPPFV